MCTTIRVCLPATRETPKAKCTSCFDTLHTDTCRSSSSRDPAPVCIYALSPKLSRPHSNLSCKLWSSSLRSQPIHRSNARHFLTVVTQGECIPSDNTKRENHHRNCNEATKMVNAAHSPTAHTGVSSPQCPSGKNDPETHNKRAPIIKAAGPIPWRKQTTSEEGKLLPLLTKITAIDHKASQIPKPCMSITPTWPLRNITS